MRDTDRPSTSQLRNNTSPAIEQGIGILDHLILNILIAINSSPLSFFSSTIKLFGWSVYQQYIFSFQGQGVCCRGLGI